MNQINKESQIIEKILDASFNRFSNGLRKVRILKELLDYVDSLKDSRAKQIVLAAEANYNESKNYERRFQEKFLMPLLESKSEILICCVLGELQEALMMINDRDFFRKRAATYGNEYSAYNLGLDYWYQDAIESAAYWFEIAVDKQYFPAYYLLGKCYLKLDWSDNIKKAEEVLLVGANFGSKECQRTLGEIYYDKQDTPEMLKWYHMAANNNDNRAQCYLGHYYYIYNRLDDAIKWHTKSANNKDLDISYKYSKYLSDIYERLTYEDNMILSDCWTCETEEKIDYPAANMISRFFLAEQAFYNKDYDDAIVQYKMVNSAHAYKRLARIYQLLKNYKEVIFWNEKLYDQHFYPILANRAARKIGQTYLKVYHDEEMGLRWYKKSAVRGDIWAGIFLGKYYEKKQQYELAIYWYARFTKEMTKSDLINDDAHYSKLNQSHGKANAKMAKLLFKLGYDEIAKYYYFSTCEGIKDERYEKYVQKIKAYEDDIHKILY